MDTSPWVGLDREQFHRYAYDPARLARLSEHKTFHLQSGYAEEVSERRPGRIRKSEHVQQERFYLG